MCNISGSLHSTAKKENYKYRVGLLFSAHDAMNTSANKILNLLTYYKVHFSVHP